MSVAMLAAIGWWYVLAHAAIGEMGAMPAAHPPPLGALVAMWSLMMVAMMLPSATPAILLYARVRAFRGDVVVAPTSVFLGGYVSLWLAFSIVVAAAQRLLVGSSAALDSRFAQAGVLIFAGLYQLSPLKSACLRQCRSAGQFFSLNWRPGWNGAILLGLRHGTYCLGCCWALMALLFVGGVMNLLWIVGLTLLVAVEKLMPGGRLIGRLAGIALIAAGAILLIEI
jgi:predicted metal-binding membrane protein